MKKDEIFFGENGLTSTSANHIANLAKEFVQNQQMLLDTIKLYDTDIKLIGKDAASPYSIGMKEEVFRTIPKILLEIAEATSLIAWLREALKAKTNLKTELRNYSFEDYCSDNGFEVPQRPVEKAALTENEYYGTLSIKERNRYYYLETLASTIGKFIHPNGSLGTARKNLMDVINNPINIKGSGRDTIIYNYRPSVNSSLVEEIFFELQKQHREAQAALNSIKYECEKAVQDSEAECNQDFGKRWEEYNIKHKELYNKYQAYTLAKDKEISRLKIIIPNSLNAIYNKIASLGK